ncbi:HK97 gp10 family phage protein [Enterococcus faecalis]|uniref:HK97 gp10 family phage protein n=1 Tax=Enterococcus faecalis TaxID=1351 RepID=UPI003D2E7BE3
MGVEVRGLDRLKRKTKQVVEIVTDAAWDATFELTELIRGAAELRLASSVKYGSGELLGSLKNEVVVDVKGCLVGRVWSDKEQAIYRELGTGPNGEASSKNLPEGVSPVYSQTAWFIPAEKVPIDLEAIYGIPKITIQGKDFFLTKGQPSRPFLYPSLEEMIEHAPEVYKKHVQKGLRML